MVWKKLSKKVIPISVEAMRKCQNFAEIQRVTDMKVITIDSEAYKALVRKIDRIFNYVKEQKEKDALPSTDPSEIWIGNEEAAGILEISQRTLQRLRSTGEITYSIRGGRARYTLQEVHRLIVGRVVASKYRQETDLLQAHQEYLERKKINQKK